jgi:hypothetical protein
LAEADPAKIASQINVAVWESSPGSSSLFGETSRVGDSMRIGETSRIHQLRRWIGAVSLPCLAVLVFVTSGLLRVSAADVAGAEQSSRSDQKLQFESVPTSPVREGYLKFSWNAVAGAVDYEVRAADGLSYYRGAALQAFVSGLSDGEYQFQVSAIDGSGEILANSDTATVVVQHWPLANALSLFAVGLLVVISILVVIIRGTSRAKDDASVTIGGRP